MSARFPIPWRAEGRDNGLCGQHRREWWAVLDRNGFLVAEGLDETTAHEIVAAVNARASIREAIAEMEGEAALAWEGTPLRRSLVKYVLRFREIFGLRENQTTKEKK